MRCYETPVRPAGVICSQSLLQQRPTQEICSSCESQGIAGHLAEGRRKCQSQGTKRMRRMGQGIFLVTLPAGLIPANEDAFTKQKVGVGRRKAEPWSPSPSQWLPCCDCSPADNRHCGVDECVCSTWHVARTNKWKLQPAESRPWRTGKKLPKNRSLLEKCRLSYIKLLNSIHDRISFS